MSGPQSEFSPKIHADIGALSPLNDHGPWPQGGTDIQAVTAGSQVRTGPHTHTGCPQSPHGTLTPESLSLVPAAASRANRSSSREPTLDSRFLRSGRRGGGGAAAPLGDGLDPGDAPGGVRRGRK